MIARSRKGASIAAATVVAAAVAIAIPAAGSAKPRHHKPAPKPKIVKVADDYYSPSTLTISKGKSIRWSWGYSNADIHNVRLKQGPRGVKKSYFRSPSATVGVTFQRKLTTPGTYKFICSLHSTVMRMQVVVKNH